VPPSRPFLALLAAFCLLFGLPTAGADAKKKSHHVKRHHCAKAAKRKHGKRKHGKHKLATLAKFKRCHKKHRKPGAGTTSPGSDTSVNQPEPNTSAEGVRRIGKISAVDTDLVTVTLDAGGTLSARITDDSDVICEASAAADDGDDTADDDTGADDGADEDDGEDPIDSDDDTFDDETGPIDDSRSSRAAATCTPAVGDPVYAAEVDDWGDGKFFTTLDLLGA
jgi:hypothetical protein